MIKELKFVCPCCTGTELEERSHGYVYHAITGISVEVGSEEPEIEWGENNFDGLEVKGYQCALCSEVISEGASTKDLIDALLKLPCNATTEREDAK